MTGIETLQVVGSIMLPFAIFLLCAGLGEILDRSNHE